MTHSKTQIEQFRKAYTDAYVEGYNGSKRDFCGLVIRAPQVFAAGLADAALAWERYMDVDQRTERREKRQPYIENDGARFRRPERVR